MVGSYETNPMPIRHEIKSQLAKLLATEDLVVEHKKVSTACFNVHTRVLTLPLWEKASGLVYDLLVGHEVGHALFTPDEDWTEKVKVPPQFVNIVEDARVEKLMKRKYAGLAKTFFNGYKELNEEDFFQIADDDISTFNLADRVNLYFKIGNFVSLNFNSEEKEIIDLIAVSETFADVLIASEELYKYCKKEKEQEQKVADFDSHEMQGDSQSPANEIVESNDSSSEQDGESDNSQPQENDGSYGGTAQGDQTPVKSSGEEDEPEVRTADSLEEKIRDLVNNESYETIYIQVPQLNLDTVIGNNSDIHKEINTSFSHQQKLHNEHAKEKGYTPANLYKESDVEFVKFKSSAQKEVNYLVKEFECRKAADQYARASTARTGVLDTARLHTYKYNEDLFKKVSVIPDGKNHGLVFVLDWSGSMSDVMLDTCKQLFNLVWFCKKVSIPFEVYAFTNEWRRGEYDYEKDRYIAADRIPHYQKKESLLVVDETFSMMNILTSKVSGKELEHQLLNIWRLAYCFAGSRQYQSPYTYPNRLCLSGTPLNEALISLHEILPKFQKENKLQKVQCIILTDGEANQLVYHKEVRRSYSDKPVLGTGYVYPHNTFLRDRKLGTTYKIDHGYHAFTDTLLRNLKDKFSSTNFIGIRVLESRNAQRFISLYHSQLDKQYEKIQNDWKKLRSFIITNSGYDAYLGMSATALAQDTEFEVAEDATKSQIKSAFVKSLKTKKLNKKVLGEFISLVV
jgi:hypothetical protein